MVVVGRGGILVRVIAWVRHDFMRRYETKAIAMLELVWLDMFAYARVAVNSIILLGSGPSKTMIDELGQTGFPRTKQSETIHDNAKYLYCTRVHVQPSLRLGILPQPWTHH